MFKVAVIVGSLRKDSYNQKLAHALDKLKHPDLQFCPVKVADIPLYNQDLDDYLPDAVIRFKHQISVADAVLFVTPEYNRSLPGVLKNIIDWGTRPYGKNVWTAKPMAVIGTSPGGVGTAVAQSHFRSIMAAQNAVLLNLPEVYLVYKDELIDNDFNITVDNTRTFLQNFLDKFAENVGQHKAKQ